MLRNVEFSIVFWGFWWFSRWKPMSDICGGNLDKSRSLIWWQHVGQPDDVVAWRREQRSYADSWMSRCRLGGELKTPGSNWHSWLLTSTRIEDWFSYWKMEDISAPAISWIGQNGSKLIRTPLKCSPRPVHGWNVWEIIVLRPYSLLVGGFNPSEKY